MPQSWAALKPGDMIYILAPASKGKLSDLNKAIALLTSWGFKSAYAPTIFGPHPLSNTFANTDEARFEDLYYALSNPEIKAIWCLRGGYGSMRLISYLDDKPPIFPPKLFIGFSDVTFLHIYLQQRWDWNTLHGPGISQVVNAHICANDIETIKQLLLGTHSQLIIDKLSPMNSTAQREYSCDGPMIGGNLTLISRTLGTPYAIDCKNKIILIEEVGEPFRKIDGMLLQLELAGYFSDNKPKAVILGNFIFSGENADNMEIERCLQDFAGRLDKKNIPVVRDIGVGHGERNHPVPMGAEAKLKLGLAPNLAISVPEHIIEEKPCLHL